MNEDLMTARASRSLEWMRSWSVVCLLAIVAPACADQLATTEEVAELTGNLQGAVIPRLPPVPNLTVSTIPPSGDVNPYGVAFVPKRFPDGGKIHFGDILVSNFNNSENLQGTGSSIVTVHPDGTQMLFFQGPPGLGLTTALGILESGFVIVGNVPSTNTSDPGMCMNLETDVGQGALTVIDKNGHAVQTIANPTFLDGPWDLTIRERGAHPTVFVSNVRSGTVTRLDLEVHDTGCGGALPIEVERMTQIASGYVHSCDPAAFVIGPTGLALDEPHDKLFVASTGDNKIFAISDASDRTHDAGTGKVFIADNAHLRGPLGLALTPNGGLLISNGDAINSDPTGVHVSEIVEYDRHGHFVAELQVDPMAGAAFGIALARRGNRLILAAVDDATNQLKVWKTQ
ncbi:MAG TPA: hypothetical protein VN253_29405 [Kofleriaceae bacterium]|nr:hypothetical protein [Kofleriaceae bacterium]